MLFSGTFFLWFAVVPLVLSLVSLQFPLNCFQYTDTRILKFCHFDLLNIAVFFSFLLFSGSDLSLLSSRMVKSWPINPKSPQWSDKIPALPAFVFFPVSQITLVFISQMEKLRLEEGISFPEHSWSFLELRSECRTLPQSCSANTVHFLSVPIVFCIFLFLFSDASKYSDSFLSLTSGQCTWVSHWSRPDSSSIRQQIVFVCVLTVLSRLTSAGLVPSTPVPLLSVSSCRALGSVPGRVHRPVPEHHHLQERY